MKLIHIHGVWPLYTNTFLVITAAGHAVVVDPAAEAETYLAQLKENNATLTEIFLTHGHYDHVGSVAALKKATGAKVHMDLADCGCRPGRRRNSRCSRRDHSGRACSRASRPSSA